MLQIPEEFTVNDLKYQYVGDSLGIFETQEQAEQYKQILSDNMRGKFALLNTGEFVDVAIIIVKMSSLIQPLHPIFVLYWRRVA